MWNCHHIIPRDVISEKSTLVQALSLSGNNCAQVFCAPLNSLWKFCITGFSTVASPHSRPVMPWRFSQDVICYHFIMVMPHGHLAPQITGIQLFVQQLVQANNKEKTQSYTLPALCEGNHWSLVDSPHIGPVMCKAFSCHYTVMSLTRCFNRATSWFTWARFSSFCDAWPCSWFWHSTNSSWVCKKSKK